MSNAVDPKPKGDLAPEVLSDKGVSQVEHGHDYDLDQKAKMAEYKADAIEAENAEHNMTVLEAVRAYPMASFWAFVMSCTIVSCPFLLSPFSA